MSILNVNAKEIHCKILYCGPDGAGKKSSLLYIKDQYKEDQRDFFILPFKKEVYGLTLSIGKIFGFQTFFHVYNLSNESAKDNKNLLRGADGAVFVANSDPNEEQNNRDSFSEMSLALKEARKDIFKWPLVLQYNKRDIKNPQPIKEMRVALNKYNSRDFKSSVLKRQFVLEPLKYVCKLTLSRLKTS